MKSIKNVRDAVNALTGKTGRQNKALDAVTEWAATVQAFLTRFDLYGSAELGTLLEKPGDAKFDLVGIIYNGRPMVGTARAFKKADLPALVEVVVNGAEATRRYLMDPELQEVNLKKSVLNLRVDYERLAAELQRIIAEQ